MEEKMKRNILKAIPYGLLKSFAVYLLLELFIPTFGNEISAVWSFRLSALAAIPFAVIYCLFESKQKSLKSILLFFTIGFVSYISGLSIVTLLSVLRVILMDSGDAYGAAGAMIIPSARYFTLVSFFFELVISVILYLKNKEHKE